MKLLAGLQLNVVHLVALELEMALNQDDNKFTAVKQIALLASYVASYSAAQLKLDTRTHVSC